MKYIGKREILSLVFSLVCFFAANIMLCQEIAPVPPDPAVKSGQLPNGLRWYVATAQDIRGTADFALVQMTGTGTVQSISGEIVRDIAKESLMSQPLLTAPSVQDFFIAKGCIPGPEGFAEINENATIFRFRGVNLRQSDTVLDSTLLVLMGIAGRPYWAGDTLMRKWYTPADQAIIVAGDVNPDVVASKLHMLSYMVPKSEPLPRPGYLWQDQPGIRTEIRRSDDPGITCVAARWRLERTPRELMNTIQPAVQEKYMTMAGLVARERLLQHFRSMGIPVAAVQTSYEGGAGALGDGEFVVEVTLSSENTIEAVSALADVLASIDAYGVTVSEGGRSALEFSDMVCKEVRHKGLGNLEYVNRCISAFIHNTPLSSRKDIVRFYSSRELSSETESTLLHSVASASIEGDRNLTLKYTADSLMLSADSLTAIFSDAWQKARVRIPQAPEVRPVPHISAEEAKVKIKSVKKETLSGGSAWTLSNGIKVIVRNMPTEDSRVHYSLSLNGGTGNIEGLSIDDGGYLSDYLDHCRIGGVSGKTFKEVVRSRGVILSYAVGHSSTKITGSVPDDGLGYMLRVLRTLMNDRQPDSQAWEYYLKGEDLRQAANTASGTGICLTDDFALKADEFFSTLSENINNGMLILVGNVDEKKLKAALMTYAGAFRTTDRPFRRTSSLARNFSGMEGYRRQGDQKSVNVALTAPMVLTAENYYTAALTAMVLRRHFALELAGKGMRVNVGCECRRYPQESVLMKISISEASIDGFACGTSDYNMGVALATMRKVFSDMSSVSIDAGVLASYRYQLEKLVAGQKQTPEYWVNALNLRYLDGKDFSTGAEAKINAVAENNIRDLLATLGSNSKIEYVITGK